VLTSNGGGGTKASYIPQLFNLTVNPDAVAGSDTSQITAIDATLSPGDTIDGGARTSNTIQSTLQLTGAGTFDLSLPRCSPASPSSRATVPAPAWG